MSEIIENKRIKKLPTSQLILYMTSPELVSLNDKEQIEKVLSERLIRKYKLYPETAKKFVEREQGIMENRGYDIDNYSFGRDLPYEELFKIFYEQAEINLQNEEYESRLFNLTMSEIAEYWAWFSIYKKRFEKRQGYYDTGLRCIINAQGALLSSGVPFKTYEEEFLQVTDMIQELDKHKEKEKFLIEYNGLINLFMLSEMKEIMGYSDLLRTYITLIREIGLLRQPSPIQKKEKAEYKDITFDAYLHYSAPIVKYLSYKE